MMKRSRPSRKKSSRSMRNLSYWTLSPNPSPSLNLTLMLSLNWSSLNQTLSSRRAGASAEGAPWALSETVHVVNESVALSRPTSSRAWERGFHHPLWTYVSRQ